MDTPNIKPTPQQLANALREHFGFTAFRDGQEDAVKQVLEGHDVVVVMPTGSGKSLCFQLAAMMLSGVTLVISPLIALMKDQVDSLTARGLPATFINSSLDADEARERIAGMIAGRYKLVYVAPERFRVPAFAEALKEVPVSMIVVDEAHCISQWGHDFRPDYLHLRRVVDAFPEARVMALTATATPHVREDIVRQLGFGDGCKAAPKVFVQGFARPNLRLAVHQTSTHDQKVRCIQRLVKAWSTGIIYCATRKMTENVHEKLQAFLPSCGVYHAGLEDDERHKTQERFMNKELDVVVATNAFGMGVDRSDLRFVVHWDMPGSIESYYQEIGRAGRDGEEARCELLFNYADMRTQEFFIEGSNPTPEDVRAVWEVVQSDCRRRPVTRSIKEWTAAVPATRNSMAVHTVMGILERTGLIHREMEAGARTYTTRLVKGADAKALEQHFPRLREKRLHDEKKLKEMLLYATTPSCRHAGLLKYFGDRDVAVPCGACDSCSTAKREGARAPNEEQWSEVQMVLSCAVRMEGRFGRGKLVHVLRGSTDAALRERGLDTLSTYGLMRECTDQYVRILVDELLRDGCLQLTTGEYPLVEITERGRDVLWRKRTPKLVWPAKSSSKARTAGRRSQADVPEEYDEAVFERLKTWRLETARSEGVPAYVVVHDATLKALAAGQAANRDELAHVHGMGAARIERYGEALLEVLAASG